MIVEWMGGSGWMGSVWIWTVIAALVVVLMVLLINEVSTE